MFRNECVITVLERQMNVDPAYEAGDCAGYHWMASSSMKSWLQGVLKVQHILLLIWVIGRMKQPDKRTKGFLIGLTTGAWIFCNLIWHPKDQLFFSCDCKKKRNDNGVCT
jgi:hypothetical protein